MRKFKREKNRRVFRLTVASLLILVLIPALSVGRRIIDKPAAVREKHEGVSLKQPPPLAITSVAPEQRQVDGRNRQARRFPIFPQGLVINPVLPEGIMDVANPPQWTDAIALPAINPPMPDPWTIPVATRDPRRKPPPDVARRHVGRRVQQPGRMAP